MRSQGGHYFWEIWSWVELSNISLLTASTIYFTSLIGKNIGEEDIDRDLLVATGSMAIIQLVSILKVYSLSVFSFLNLSLYCPCKTFFLRTTFIPFARFVGGLTLICQTLIPFFIVSALLLLAFAYGFRVFFNHKDCDIEECENMCEESLIRCYYWVLGGFFSGAEATNSDALDILFGVTAIVILLNVVIAIVSDAWELSSGQSQSLFWKFRLEFLSESRLFTYVDKVIFRGTHLDGLSQVVDRMPDINIADETPWIQKPFNVIKSKKEYDRPEDYFQPELARRIRKGHSLKADLYWIKMDIANAESQQLTNNTAGNTGTFKTSCLRCQAVMKWFFLSVLYFLLIILGIPTGGWFWPKNFRRRVLAIGL